MIMCILVKTTHISKKIDRCGWSTGGMVISVDINVIYSHLGLKSGLRIEKP
jgi:hypothetical protein